MKPKVTISISRESLDYLDRFVGKRGSSRSQVVESFIRESRQRRREEVLARRAKQFFAQPEPEDETKEREDWAKASLEALRIDR